MQIEYMAPSALCLAIKVGILCSSEIKRADRGIVTFLAGAILLNVIELTLFSMNSFNAPNLVWFVRLYYLAIFLCVSGAILSAEAIGKNRQSVFNYVWIFSCYGALITLNPFVIPGYRDFGYSISAEQGPLYWAVIAPLLLGTCFLIYLLAVAIKAHGVNGARARTLSFGLAPIILLGVVVLIGLQLGAQINAAFLMSVATLFYATTMVKNESISKLYTEKSDSKKDIDYVAFALEEGGKSALDELKRRSAQTALSESGGDKNKAAKLLNISRVSWYRWLKAGGDEELNSNKNESETSSKTKPIQSDAEQPRLTIVKPRTDS